MHVLLGDVRHHAESDDVQHREDACCGAIDDAVSEILEVAPPGTAHVDHRGHARAEAELVRQHAVVAGPGVLHAGGGKDVDMRVDETRGDVEAADIDDGPGLCGIDIAAHGRDLPVGNGDVHDGVDVVARIDDVSALEQDLIADLSAGAGNGENNQQNGPESETWVRHPLIVAETVTSERFCCCPWNVATLACNHQPARIRQGAFGLLTRVNIRAVRQLRQ